MLSAAYDVFLATVQANAFAAAAAAAAAGVVLSSVGALYFVYCTAPKPEVTTTTNGLRLWQHNAFDTKLLDYEIFGEQMYSKCGVGINDGDVVFEYVARAFIFVLFFVPP
jgi:hypothetical protein